MPKETDPTDRIVAHADLLYHVDALLRAAEELRARRDRLYAYFRAHPEPAEERASATRKRNARCRE